MRWPRKIPAGETNDGLMATLGLLPTFAALTGAKVPGDRIIDGGQSTGLSFRELPISPHLIYLQSKFVICAD